MTKYQLYAHIFWKMVLGLNLALCRHEADVLPLSCIPTLYFFSFFEKIRMPSFLGVSDQHRIYYFAPYWAVLRPWLAFFFLKTRVYWKGNQYAELYSPCMHPITTGFVFAQHWTTSQWPGTIVWSARAIKDSDIEEASVLWGSVGRGRS